MTCQRVVVSLLTVGLVGVTWSCASGGARATDATPVRALPAEATPPSAPSALPATYAAEFAARDARARAIVFYQQCSATVIRLRAGGSFGAAASAPRAVYCERTADGVPIGGVFDIDSNFTRARRLTMIRLDGARPKFTDAVDTARIAVEAKLIRDITRDVSAGWRLLKRPFVVAPVVPPDGALEGWVIPLPTKARSAVLGGEIGLTRASTGGLERLTDHLGTWKQVPIPASGAVTLVSSERELPAVADIAVARGLADAGREVVVTTTTAKSALVSGTDAATGSRFTWQHTRTSP
jgi:hypothetical protein